MPPKDREDVREPAHDVRIVYARSSVHPIEYAITLRVQRDGQWRTIHLFDNAHSVDEHHEHRYVGDRKQPPTLVETDTNGAMAAAMGTLEACWTDIVKAWEETR